MEREKAVEILLASMRGVGQLPDSCAEFLDIAKALSGETPDEQLGSISYLFEKNLERRRCSSSEIFEAVYGDSTGREYWRGWFYQPSMTVREFVDLIALQAATEYYDIHGEGSKATEKLTHTRRDLTIYLREAAEMDILVFKGDVEALKWFTGVMNGVWYFTKNPGSVFANPHIKTLEDVKIGPLDTLRWFADNPERSPLLPKSLRDWYGSQLGTGQKAGKRTLRGETGHTDDRRFMEIAISEAAKCNAEDTRTRPKVGAVVVKDGEILAKGYRGELAPGEHAEFTVLEQKLKDRSVAGATVYTTLEPCTTRNHPKIPCADRLAERKVSRVVIGMVDPDDRISGKGQKRLRKAGIAIDLFAPDLMAQVEEMNRSFVREKEKEEQSTAASADGQVVELSGSMYVIGKTLRDYRGYKVEDMLVNSIWPTKSGVQQEWERKGYQLRWSRPEKVASRRTDGWEVLYEVDKIEHVRRRITQKGGNVLIGKLI
jgi:pyrimidine deaminase RibD-like protein